MNEKTTIKVGQETKERIRKLGEKGDTYEDIIKKVLEASELEEDR